MAYASPQANSQSTVYTMIPPSRAPIEQRQPKSLRSLQESVTALGRDSSRSRKRKDLARTALDLATCFDENGHRRERVMRDILQLAIFAIDSPKQDEEIYGIRLNFVKFIDNKPVSEEIVHEYIKPLLTAFLSQHHPATLTQTEGDSRENLAKIKDNKKLGLPERDLAGSALTLINALRGDTLEIHGVERAIMKLVLGAISSGNQAYEIREKIEEILDANPNACPLDAVRKGLQLPMETPEHASRSNRTRGPQDPSKTSGRPSLAIQREKKGGKTVYDTKADSQQRVGHNFKFAANRDTRLPDNISDLSITERDHHHDTEVRGKRNDRIGHDFEFN